MDEKQKAAALLGRAGGLKKSERKREAVLRNLAKANDVRRLKNKSK